MSQTEPHSLVEGLLHGNKMPKAHTLKSWALSVLGSATHATVLGQHPCVMQLGSVAYTGLTQEQAALM